PRCCDSRAARESQTGRSDDVAAKRSARDRRQRGRLRHHEEPNRLVAASRTADPRAARGVARSACDGPARRPREADRRADRTCGDAAPGSLCAGERRSAKGRGDRLGVGGRTRAGRGTAGGGSTSLTHAGTTSGTGAAGTTATGGGSNTVSGNGHGKGGSGGQGKHLGQSDTAPGNAGGQGNGQGDPGNGQSNAGGQGNGQG